MAESMGSKQTGGRCRPPEILADEDRLAQKFIADLQADDPGPQGDFGLDELALTT